MPDHDYPNEALQRAVEHVRGSQDATEAALRELDAVGNHEAHTAEQFLRIAADAAEAAAERLALIEGKATN
jgi:hypothetical protein